MNLCAVPQLEVDVEFIAREHSFTVRGPYDTGSQISFVRKDLVAEHLPNLWNKLEPCGVRIIGVGGKPLEVSGCLSLDCRVAGRRLQHEFVVARICEPVLIGMDFIRQHKAIWDWRVGEIRFQREEVMCGVADIRDRADGLPVTLPLRWS